MSRIVLLQISLSNEVKIANSAMDILRLNFLVPLNVGVQQVLIRKRLRTLATLELFCFLRRMHQLHVSRQSGIISERDITLFAAFLLDPSVIDRVSQVRLLGVEFTTAAEQISGHLVNRLEMIRHAMPRGE